jgi:putative (di)nucleoside polyphosphate hydrolase
MIDNNGFRSNIAIVLMNAHQQVFWGRRVGGHDAWQFPQGGMMQGESHEQAMYRELHEELGLLPQHVSVIASMGPWAYYRIPRHFRRYHSKPLCIGQKQKWFLLRLNMPDSTLCLDHAEKPEFDQFRWVDMAYAVDNIIDFKRKVYLKAYRCFADHLDKTKAQNTQNTKDLDD